jgi:predicted DNA-binding ribbon-helix-helix protein
MAYPVGSAELFRYGTKSSLKRLRLPIIRSMGRHAVKSSIAKRSIVLAGHKTSVSLEQPFWNSLKEIASDRDMALSELVAEVDAGRQHGNLSCALRLFVLGFYRDQIPTRAGRMQLA